MFDGYLKDYQGIAKADYVKVNLGDTVRLPDHPCKAVKLVRWNADSTVAYTLKYAAGTQPEDTDGEVYYGFNGQPFAPLFPGRESDLLWVNNTNQISITLPAKGGGNPDQFIYFVYFI